MTNTPEKIYLNVGPVEPDVDFAELREVTWSPARLEETCVEYVRADSLTDLALEKRLEQISDPKEVARALIIAGLRLHAEHRIAVGKRLIDIDTIIQKAFEFAADNGEIYRDESGVMCIDKDHMKSLAAKFKETI